MSAKEAAAKWGISKRRVQTLCSNNRIDNATRVGNMWLIPKSAQKPDDARKKKEELRVEHTSINPTKAARAELRTMARNTYSLLVTDGVPRHLAKMQIVTIYASTLLSYYCDNIPSEGLLPESQELEQIHKSINSQIGLDVFSINPDNLRVLSKEFFSFIKRYKYCLDDSLSWIYQFINKISLDTGLESTQFFTEKYMIASLIDNSNISSNSEKILDPACGGGNFLLYTMDYLCDKLINSRHNNEEIRAIILSILKRLYGYELDSYLAMVANLNLKLKALAILCAHSVPVTIHDWKLFEPNIYYSKSKNIYGALDVTPGEHIVIRASDNSSATLQDVFQNTYYIFTNPPFQTVKGMDCSLKEYLKQHFPLSKCDLCNAFIQRSLEILDSEGTCGLVTQNSWMFLNSFANFRKMLLENYSIRSIIELGSNAFYDINGEKANVSLVRIDKTLPTPTTMIEVSCLMDLKQPQKEIVVATEGNMKKHVLPQHECLKNDSFRLNILSTCALKSSLGSFYPYSQFATPMQGTSTGNSAELIDYFWNHLDDDEWTLVSKGGGYSRWNGLNCYVLRWGKNGQYIKATPGSALRNVKYFNETELVFSDTGTAGLNVRLLHKGQLFVSSGPGIRIHYGDKFSHLSLLNSRLFSYCIRTTSPKLTIAAGYIAKIPTKKELLTSSELSEYGHRCYELKTAFLSRRPTNIEFVPLTDCFAKSITELAQEYFLEDINNELERLKLERKIDDIILQAYGFSKEDKLQIAREIGEVAASIDTVRVFQADQLDIEISNLLDENCTLKRTQASKSTLGCDGILEYLSKHKGYNPQRLMSYITKNLDHFPLTLMKYEAFILHSIILTLLGYSTNHRPFYKKLSIKQLKSLFMKKFPNHKFDFPYVVEWIDNHFNSFHSKAFFKSPVYWYNSKTNSFELL